MRTQFTRDFIASQLKVITGEAYYLEEGTKRLDVIYAIHHLEEFVEECFEFDFFKLRRDIDRVMEKLEIDPEEKVIDITK